MIKLTHLLGLLTLTMTFAGVASAQKIDLPRRDGVKIKRPLKLQIRDLAAHRIEMRVLSRSSEFGGRVRITGVVKNVGNLAYRSRAGQQSAYLYAGRRLVARTAFTSLAPGAEVKVSFDTTLSTSNEFPVEWKLVVAFDPDIAIDGNPHNDDMRRANNSKTRTGYDLHREWRMLERLRKIRESRLRKVRRPLPRIGG